MTQTAATVTLLAAIGQLAHQGKFAPLTQTDRYAFCEAADDAQIAHDGATVASALCDLTGRSILTEGDAVTVIVSDQRVEVHAETPEGDRVSVAFDLAVEG